MTTCASIYEGNLVALSVKHSERVQMESELREFIRKSFLAYRQGQYSRLMGPEYDEYLHSLTIDELCDATIEAYHKTFDVAFKDHRPRSDEIYLFVMDDSCVVTNQRLFLIDKKSLIHGPIDLSDIKSYTCTGNWRLRQVIELTSGEKIERRVSLAPDTDAMARLVDCARTPEHADILHRMSEPLREGVSVDEPPDGSIEAQRDLAPVRLRELAAEMMTEQEVEQVGIAIWKSLGTSTKSGFFLWVYRLFFGGLGDSLAPDLRCLGVVALSQDGHLSVGKIGEVNSSEQISSSLVIDSKLDKTSIIKVSVENISTSRMAKSITLNVFDRLELEFPKCFIAGNEGWPELLVEKRLEIEQG